MKLISILALSMVACIPPSFGSCGTDSSTQKPNVLHTSRPLHQDQFHVESDDHSTTDEEDRKEPPIRSSIPNLTDSIFATMTKHGSVVVLFSAKWCGSCRKFAPQYEALARRHPNTRFYRCDVDDGCPATTERFQVSIVPTMLLFHGGMRAGSLTGAYDDAVLDRFVESSML